ncbi:MAG: CHASE2 domain-containing protein [Limisphaerales bacterium]
MKPKAARFIPLLIAAAVISVFSFLEVLPRFLPGFQVFERLEWITYDWRMRGAAKKTQPAAPNLAAVFIDDDNIRYFNTNENYNFSFPWPRHLHGWLLEELKGAGAKAVAFDVLFTETHPATPRTSVRLPGGKMVSGDEFFATQLLEHQGAILACAGETLANLMAGFTPGRPVSHQRSLSGAHRQPGRFRWGAPPCHSLPR